MVSTINLECYTVYMMNVW